MTRDEWCKLWESIRTIEYLVGRINRYAIREAVRREVDFIKKKIQEEIGQME